MIRSIDQDKIPFKKFETFDGVYSDGTRLQVRALDYDRAMRMLEILGAGAALVSCLRVG